MPGLRRFLCHSPIHRFPHCQRIGRGIKRRPEGMLLRYRSPWPVPQPERGQSVVLLQRLHVGQILGTINHCTPEDEHGRGA